MRNLSVYQSGLVGIMAAMLFISPVAGAQERIPENTMLVQGFGKSIAQPDTVSMSFGVETKEKTLEAARQENARRMSQAIAQIKALNINGLKLQTNGFSAYPIYEPEKPDTRKKLNPIIGYQVHNNITVTISKPNVPSDQLAQETSRVLDTALGLGATQASGPSFSVGYENPAQKEALKLAVEQAMRHAETIAQAAHVKLTGVYTIDAYSQQPIAAQPYAMAMKAEYADAGARVATPIESGEYEVNANVTIRFDFSDLP